MSNCVKEIDCLKRRDDVRHESRNEFTTMFHKVNDSLDSLKWMLTKFGMTQEGIKKDVAHNSKEFSKHMKQEDSDRSVFIQSIKDLTGSLNDHRKSMNRELSKKIPFSMFWTLWGFVVWIGFILAGLFYSEIKESRKQLQYTRDEVIEVKTLIESIHKYRE